MCGDTAVEQQTRVSEENNSRPDVKHRFNTTFGELLTSIWVCQYRKRVVFSERVYLLTSPRLVPGVRYKVSGFGAEVFQEGFGGRFGVEDV